jgi:hypothetical protein
MTSVEFSLPGIVLFSNSNKIRLTCGYVYVDIIA